MERAARRKELKCVIMAPNVEDIQSRGGLNEYQISISTYCKENNIPLLICLTRTSLGKAMGKKMPLSVVGVLDYSGWGKI